MRRLCGLLFAGVLLILVILAQSPVARAVTDAWERVSTGGSGQEGDRDGALWAVSAVASDNVWAVGEYVSGTTRTLIMHWNGSEWSTVSSPNVGTGTNRLYGVAATAPGQSNEVFVWAVGQYYDSAGRANPLILGYDGTNWAQASVPSVSDCSASSNNRYELRDVAMLAPGHAWAVGFCTDANTSNDLQIRTITFEFLGTNGWQHRSSPNPASNGESELYESRKFLGVVLLDQRGQSGIS